MQSVHLIVNTSRVNFTQTINKLAAHYLRTLISNSKTLPQNEDMKAAYFTGLLFFINLSAIAMPEHISNQNTITSISETPLHDAIEVYSNEFASDNDLPMTNSQLPDSIYYATIYKSAKQLFEVPMCNVDLIAKLDPKTVEKISPYLLEDAPAKYSEQLSIASPLDSYSDRLAITNDLQSIHFGFVGSIYFPVPAKVSEFGDEYTAVRFTIACESLIRRLKRGFSGPDTVAIKVPLKNKEQQLLLIPSPAITNMFFINNSKKD